MFNVRPGLIATFALIKRMFNFLISYYLRFVMLRRILPLLLFSAIKASAAFSPVDSIIPRSINAVLITDGITVDGKLEEAAWSGAQPASDFTQYSPFSGSAPTFETEVRILYNDRGVYFGARMYDHSPDSILRQLGTRDYAANADLLTIKIDAYCNAQDAYIFQVYASGTQADSRLQDVSFNAVWQNACRIDDKGWTAEIFIPFSAVRFYPAPEQTWRIQFERQLRRKREVSQWAAEPRGVDKAQNYWGLLSGIKNINPPVRLSLNPYFSVGLSHYPYGNKASDYSYSFSGGLDLKYGISEAFTLDMTLMPDFSQVQSDDVVKNLSAFETSYSEQRNFFMEATDLFAKGGLFYSRRIGRTPGQFYNVYSQLSSGEEVVKNPSQAKLINAFKISGRNRSGTALGIFNAITGNTYAIIRDSAGNKRDFLTEPAANYNIIVADQSLKNNSSVYFINSNVSRKPGYTQSNFSAAGLSLYSPGRYWLFSAGGGAGTKSGGDLPEYGLNSMAYKYSLTVSKVKGNVQGSVFHNSTDAGFDINDLGMIHITDVNNQGAKVTYQHFKPAGSIYDFRIGAEINYSNRKSGGELTEANAAINGMILTSNFITFWFDCTRQFARNHDFYEPRVNGYYYLGPRWTYFEGNISTNYKKPLAFDGNIHYTVIEEAGGKLFGVYAGPIVKIGNHWSMAFDSEFSSENNNVGFATLDTLGVPVFGIRDVKTYTQTLSARYAFSTRMDISLRFRHYHSKGEYSKYLYLNDMGIAADSAGSYNEDFNFNALSVDLVYSWYFAPGSVLNVVFKDNLVSEDLPLAFTYFENVGRTFDQKQNKFVSLKVIYYLDYNQIKNYGKKS